MSGSAGFSFALFAIASTLMLCAAARGADRISGRMFATRSEVLAQHGVAATSHPLATQAAIDVLRQGGSAVDAAIAANACLALMEPVSCGLGGDLFAIVWDPKTRKLHGLNASGRSPIGQSLESLRGKLGEAKKIPSFGPLPVTVPGCVDGWFELHARFGRLPMAQALAPAIGYARDGFPVTQLVAYYWERGGRVLREYPGFAETFLPDGVAPGEGAIFRNPRLAATLEKLSAGGRDAFYRGELAEVMDAFFRRVGSALTKDDLAGHASTWVDPVSVNYRGYDVWELPPSGQGIAALQMLRILQAYDLRALGHNTVETLHLMIEAKKLAFEDRARHYADPDFASIPIAWLLSEEYAAQRRALIDPKRAARQFPPGDPPPAGGASLGLRPDALAHADQRLREGDTIYLATADADGMMVSLIQSNYRGFGSGLCPDGLGFCLQDRGEMFSLDPAHPNVYAPGKRPFHTIIPGFVTRGGEPWLSFGVMGGDMQPQGHVQVLCNVIDFGMNLQEAGDATRWYHTGSSEPTDERMTDSGVVALESGISPEVRRALEQMGHRLEDVIGPFGGYQAIALDPATRVYHAASESRKDGCAAGF